MTTSTPANTPHGVEIKISGFGVTPVAVSTTLPAAVAQLTQQGKTIFNFLPAKADFFSDIIYSFSVGTNSYAILSSFFETANKRIRISI